MKKFRNYTHVTITGECYNLKCKQFTKYTGGVLLNDWKKKS